MGLIVCCDGLQPKGHGRELPPHTRWLVWWRCLGLQAAWNPQRMQNLGLLAALAPWVRWRGLDPGERRLLARRYLGYFNTNPYLAPFVVGGLVKLENDRADGQEVPERLVDGFRNTMSRVCGAIGDQLFWLGVRPAVMLLAVVLGWLVAWWLVLVTVGGFAITQVGLRYHALSLGLRLGPDVVDVLSRPLWHRAIAWTTRLALALTGLVSGVYFAGVPDGDQPAVLGRVVGCLLIGLGLPAVVQQRQPGEIQLLWGLAGLAGLVLIF